MARRAGGSALTDVTGFGLAGHLMEMCCGANLSAAIDSNTIPELPGLDDYIARGCVPGGTQRNYEALGHALPTLSPRELAVLCDPQTSGGLLVAVSPDALSGVQRLLQEQKLPRAVVGSLTPSDNGKPAIRLQTGWPR